MPDNPEADFLTRSQHAALVRLKELAELGDQQTSYAGFLVRTNILIYGPSGAGKTKVVTRLARHLGIKADYPVLHITAPGWIILGAKAEPATLTVIRSFVRRHPRGVLFLDEIDKALPRGNAAVMEGWYVSMTGELLSFLDKSDRLLFAGWTHEDIARLSNYLVVGAGAWQRAYDLAEQDGTTHEEQLREDLGIPPEIARRFSDRYIQVSEPEKADYMAALCLLYQDLGLPAPSESLLDVIADGAVSSSFGMRYIELHLADLLTKYPQLRRKTGAPAVDKSPPLKVLPPQAYEEEIRHAYKLLEALGSIIPHVRVQVRLHASHLFLTEDDLLNLTGVNRMTPGQFDASCTELMSATYLRYSVNREALLQQHAVFWRSAHVVCAFVTECLDEHASFLQAEEILSLFADCQVRISRAVAAWQYVCSLAPPQ